MTYTSGVRNSPKNFLHKGAFKLKRSSIIIPSKMIVNLIFFSKVPRTSCQNVMNTVCNPTTRCDQDVLIFSRSNRSTNIPCRIIDVRSPKCFTEQRNPQNAWSWQLLRNVCQPSSRRECTMVPMKTCSKEPKKQVMKIIMMRSKMIML